jgi:hypothetical protein
VKLDLMGIKQWRECRWRGYTREMQERRRSTYLLGRLRDPPPWTRLRSRASSLLREFHPTHPSILLSMPSYAHIGDELIHVSTPLLPFVPLLPPVDAEYDLFGLLSHTLVFVLIYPNTL